VKLCDASDGICRAPFSGAMNIDAATTTRLAGSFTFDFGTETIAGTFEASPCDPSTDSCP
jgi:hypothetical protein